MFFINQIFMTKEIKLVVHVLVYLVTLARFDKFINAVTVVENCELKVSY